MCRELEIVLRSAIAEEAIRNAVRSVLSGTESGYSAAILYLGNENAQMKIRRHANNVRAICADLSIELELDQKNK